MFHVAIDVVKSENPFVPSNLTHFFKFKQFYSLCWHILVNFSSVEFSDLLAQIPWLICLAYAFYEVSIKFQVVLCLPKSQSLLG